MRSLFYTLFTLAVIACGLQSCDSKGRLAQDMAGEWTSNPEKIDVKGAATSASTTHFAFILDPGSNGGNVIIESTISVSQPINEQVVYVLEPIELTASAVASIQGTWRVTDDDEVMLMLDPKSLKVSVDPEGVETIFNNLTQLSTTLVDSLKTAVLNDFTSRISAAAEKEMLSLHHLDDVEIESDGTMMHFETGKVKHTLLKDK